MRRIGRSPTPAEHLLQQALEIPTRLDILAEGFYESVIIDGPDPCPPAWADLSAAEQEKWRIATLAEIRRDVLGVYTPDDAPGTAASHTDGAYSRLVAVR